MNTKTETPQYSYTFQEYSNLFKHTYNGMFKQTERDDININKDNFIEHYDIDRMSKLKMYYRPKCTDHLEVYRTRTNGVILISTPYKQADDTVAKHYSAGFDKCMFSMHPVGYTFIKVYPDVKSFRREHATLDHWWGQNA